MGQAKLVTEDALIKLRELRDVTEEVVRSGNITDIARARLHRSQRAADSALTLAHDRLRLIRSASTNVQNIRTIENCTIRSGFTVAEFDLGPRDAA